MDDGIDDAMAVTCIVRLAHEEEVLIPVAMVEYMRALDPCPKWALQWKDGSQSESRRWDGL